MSANRVIKSQMDVYKNKYPILALTGPRQSGKTTFLKTHFSDYEYVNLENLDVRKFATDDPNGFLKQYGKYVIFDEAHQLPEVAGLFFGEDIFVAFGAIVLMHTFLRESGIETDPLHIALWGIPTALCAFAIHAYRLRQMDQALRRLQANAAAAADNTPMTVVNQTTSSGDHA